MGTAMVAEKKKLSQPVLDYAKMLHEEYGKNVQDTGMLGQKISVTPMETAAIDKLHAKGAGELAKLVPLDGEQFGRAYVAMMIKGHNEVLQMLDMQIKAAQSDELKKHLSETRQHVAMHLEKAKQLQGNTKQVQASAP